MVDTMQHPSYTHSTLTQHDHSTLATPTLPAKAPTEGGIVNSFGNSEAVELYYVEVRPRCLKVATAT